ncbi:MAG: hypothetical protein OSA98_10795 [Rubripirellula sp.]|nr:hypothetical protein [Rubripirellula sp.]
MIYNRRNFLAETATGLGLGGLLAGLGPLSAEDVVMDPGIARFSSDIEPLVQFLEATPRDSIIEETARRVQSGLSYRELLAALLLAGVRNVQPRPSVGFKFHAVLVVNSAHLASLSSADEDRWLPIFWAIDNFKNSQTRDIAEGNWTLPAVDEAHVPAAHKAAGQLRVALDQWDEQAADVAITGLVRNAGAQEIFDQLAIYAARDFRSIGHKVIYLSNAFRTLQTIGWDYAEPVMRSLVYAMLNHQGSPNPADSDLPADRPGRLNRDLLEKMPTHWRGRTADDGATRELVTAFHDCSPEQASEMVVDLINSGVAIQSIWDGIYASAGELMMRQRGIISLHSVTTTNALHHAFKTAANDQTRQYLLLQNASFLPMFREAARGRGPLADRHITDLNHEDKAKPTESVRAIFQTMGRDRPGASQMMYQYLSAGGDAQSVVDHARRLVFLKGDDSHDYKFSSAALEDYRRLSPQWRNRFLAASTFQLRNETEKTRPLVKRIQTALA